MDPRRLLPRVSSTFAFGLFLALLQIPSVTIAQPTTTPCNDFCIAPDRGDGTIDLPAPCPYASPNGDMVVTGGLPPTASIIIDPGLSNFVNVVASPGGFLGGEIVVFDAFLSAPMFGTGDLGGFARSINIPVQVEIHTAPRVPGDPIQSFDCDMFSLQGELFGDPDFTTLKVTCGGGNGLPSPGHTTLSQLPGGEFVVDSFFDIEYRIEFQGAPGSVLEGFGGQTEGTVRLEQGQDYWNPEDGHKMHYPQLPDPEGWNVYSTFPAVTGDDWRCSETGWVKDLHFWGSWLGDLQGELLSFEIGIYSDVPAGQTNPYSHPGELLWQRSVTNWCSLPMPLPNGSGWYDPPSGGVFPADHQTIYQYDIELDSLDWFWQEQETIYWLTITATVDQAFPGTWGWHSSLEHFNDDATWNNFAQAGCIAPDNGTGTADLPPLGCVYNGGQQPMQIINGLPAGSTVDIFPTLDNFVNINVSPGGVLGGEIEVFDATLFLNMNGTGSLAGFNRNIPMPVQLEIHTAPRIQGDPVQDFDCDMVRLEGQLFGDPDFMFLGIQAGQTFGLPSPGHTTLTKLPGSDAYNVESFFDIDYRIEFDGAPGSVLDGFSGVTIEIVELRLGSPLLFDPWQELYEPPTFEESMDLAFVITDGSSDLIPCECLPGDADGSGVLSIGDAVYIINFIFGGGPAPGPFAVCSGDANCDCQVSIGDAVYMINFIFGGGPAPCDCETWRASCGNP